MLWCRAGKSSPANESGAVLFWSFYLPLSLSHTLIDSLFPQHTLTLSLSSRRRLAVYSKLNGIWHVCKDCGAATVSKCQYASLRIGGEIWSFKKRDAKATRGSYRVGMGGENKTRCTRKNKTPIAWLWWWTGRVMENQGDGLRRYVDILDLEHSDVGSREQQESTSVAWNWETTWHKMDTAWACDRWSGFNNSH